MTYINDTGLPSVTDIIRPYIDATYFTEESRTRGDIVHAASASYLLGLFCPPIPPEYQGYVDSMRRWVDENVAEAILVEERLTDKRLGFCGKPDMIVKLKIHNAWISLIDIKTGAAISKSYRVQVAAYRHLASVDKGILTDRGYIVRPKEDGTGTLPLFECPQSIKADFNIFLGLLNAHKFFNSKQQGGL